ncbi:hypothetical protein FE697_000990 [Mumia zhuanghuii]|uniref:GPP34 family phosphoprotein n=2 Tax=Mumia TaxID=1546255 RepID=A0ABW1QIS8_9ACTN|nr:MULTISPECIES: GPP34 family phosphoprotein [Mumia]KAA1424538.1 hypothetical protein FE697_000990 [Mumia zhuanghuii]
MLLAEELTLLALDPQSGKLRNPDGRGARALAGALLLDLAHAGHVALEPGDILVLADTSPRQPLLGSGLSLLTGQVPLSVRDAVHHLAATLPETVLGSMATRGLLRREESRTVVLKIHVRWHPTAPAMSDAVRADLASILDSAGPEASSSAPVLGRREAGLLTVLGGADLLDFVETPTDAAAAARQRSWCADVAQGQRCLHSVADDVLAFQRAVHAGLTSAPAAHPASEQRAAAV